MEKAELARVLAAKLNVKPELADAAINEVVAEIVSPHIFVKPGEEVGLINDNHCTNNCKEELAAVALREQLIKK